MTYWAYSKLSGRRFRAALLSCLLCVAGAAVAEPRVPEEPDEVLLVIDRATRLARQNLARNQRPTGVTLHEALAQARGQLELARSSGDPRLLGHAERTLAPWTALANPPIEIQIYSAGIAQARHEFARARAVLTRVLEAEPDAANAWLMLAAITQTQGDLDTARTACARLLLLARGLVASTCSAAVAGALGRGARALETLERAHARDEPDDPQVLAWSYGVRADIARRLGRDAEAGQAYRAALAATPEHVALLAEYADFLLSTERAHEALQLLASAPEILSIELHRARALDALGRNVDASAAKQRLRERFEALRERRESGHEREEALFELELMQRPQRALSLALENWKQQREPVDARLVLASAIAAGNAIATRPVLEWRDALNLEDAEFDRLAASISLDQAAL